MWPKKYSPAYCRVGLYFGTRQIRPAIPCSVSRTSPIWRSNSNDIKLFRLRGLKFPGWVHVTASAEIFIPVRGCIERMRLWLQVDSLLHLRLSSLPAVFKVSQQKCGEQSDKSINSALCALAFQQRILEASRRWKSTAGSEFGWSVSFIHAVLIASLPHLQSSDCEGVPGERPHRQEASCSLLLALFMQCLWVGSRDGRRLLVKASVSRGEVLSNGTNRDTKGP